MGDARHTLFMPNCHSTLPVDASTAPNRSWSSQKNSRPLAVASVPPRAPPGPVCGSFPRDLPCRHFDRPQYLLIRRSGIGPRRASPVRFSGDPLADALHEHVAVLQRLHVVEPCLRGCRRWSTNSRRHVPMDRLARLRPTAPVPAPAPDVRQRRSRAPMSGD